MILGTTYFWRQNKLETLDRGVIVDDFDQSSMLKYLYCPCVIESFKFSGPRFWTGYFNESEKFKKGWTPVSIDQLPNEFRLALLIAGVQL